MSVIVKNMEMPKNCSDCPLNYDQMACKVTGTRWWSDTMVLMNFDSCKERLHDCPLIELPPHGRLIDADELVRIWTGAKFYGNIKPIVDARPTVIEAEGETDGR